jgi:hypothetical protein
VTATAVALVEAKKCSAIELLLRGGQPCVGQCTCGPRHLGGIGLWGALGGVLGGWAAVQWTMLLQATLFWGDAVLIVPRIESKTRVLILEHSRNRTKNPSTHIKGDSVLFQNSTKLRTVEICSFFSSNHKMNDS